jgi:hypothetical protein
MTKTKSHFGASFFSDGEPRLLVLLVMPRKLTELQAMRAELHAKQNSVKYALINQPVEFCLLRYCCSMCKPDYTMAVVMGLHSRLGDESPVALLTVDLVHMIMDMTKPKRPKPGWLDCTWDVYCAKRRRARAVLECSRAAQRERDHDRDYTNTA